MFNQKSFNHVKFNSNAAAETVAIQTSYSIHAEYDIPVLSNYEIYNLLSLEIQAKYNLFNSLDNSIMARYSVNSTIARDIESLYSIYNTIDKGIQAAYNINNAKSVEVNSLYTIAEAINVLIEGTFNIYDTLEQQINGKYDIAIGYCSIINADYTIYNATVKNISKMVQAWSDLHDIQIPQTVNAYGEYSYFSSTAKGRLIQTFEDTYDLNGNLIQVFGKFFTLSDLPMETTIGEYKILAKKACKNKFNEIEYYKYLLGYRSYKNNYGSMKV